VLGIVGVLDIPIIMVSVRLLRGIHPAVIVRNEGGSGLADPWMRIGLVVSAVAVLLLTAWLIRLRTEGARLLEELALLRRQAEARRGVA
jgi:heme exporter protein C